MVLFSIWNGGEEGLRRPLIAAIFAALVPLALAQQPVPTIQTFDLKQWVGKPIGDLCKSTGADLLPSNADAVANAWAFGPIVQFGFKGGTIRIDGRPGYEHYGRLDPAKPLTHDAAQSLIGAVSIRSVSYQLKDPTTVDYATGYRTMMARLGFSAAGAHARRTRDFSGQAEAGLIKFTTWTVTGIAGLPKGTTLQYDNTRSLTHPNKGEATIEIKIPAGPHDKDRLPLPSVAQESGPGTDAPAADGNAQLRRILATKEADVPALGFVYSHQGDTYGIRDLLFKNNGTWLVYKAGTLKEYQIPLTAFSFNAGVPRLSWQDVLKLAGVGFSGQRELKPVYGNRVVALGSVTGLPEGWLAYVRFQGDDATVEISNGVPDGYADRTAEAGRATLNGFTAYGGDWRATADGFTVVPGRGSKLVKNDFTFRDGQVDCDVKLEPGFGATGILFRTSRAGRGEMELLGYMFELNRGMVVLSRFDNRWFRLAQAKMDVKPGRWYHLRAVFTGHSLKMYADDMVRPAIECEDGIQPVLEGSVGLRSYDTRTTFRNLSATPAGGRPIQLSTAP